MSTERNSLIIKMASEKKNSKAGGQAALEHQKDSRQSPKIAPDEADL